MPLARIEKLFSLSFRDRCSARGGTSWRQMVAPLGQRFFGTNEAFQPQLEPCPPLVLGSRAPPYSSGTSPCPKNVGSCRRIDARLVVEKLFQSRMQTKMMKLFFREILK